ncbi:AAA family ATPase [Antarcticirhabdus aurantiaca]|uniref:AAA family ATPase n=1 Tax=Antarcticirhabdus aurantiaca TaxID=2606717 RepID=UPI00131E47E3|nr:AAA family ATPase [Antarcticirhabdus aurantiaca]
MSEKARPLRVVGRREIRESDNDADIMEHLCYDEQGNLMIEETVEVSADDAAVIVQQVAQRRESALRLVDALSPSAFAVYLAFQAALEAPAEAEAVRRRLDGDPDHLLVAVRLPSFDWYTAAEKAFAAVVALLVVDRLEIKFATTIVMTEWNREANGYRLPARTLLSAAKRVHTIATFAGDDQLPPDLRPFCDIVLDLSSIGVACFEKAISREFDWPAEHVGWSPTIDLDLLAPELLDAVVDRAPDITSVVPFLGRLLNARAVARAQSKARAAEEERKKAAKSAPATEVLRPTSPKLEDLHGYGAAAEWGRSLVDDLRLYAAGKLGWIDVDGGCLLHGAPGTGKTLMAGALAASAGLPFIAASFAQWTATGRSYQGDTISAMRKTFALANEHAPCILFIDEIDSIPARGSSQQHDDYWVPIVNALLECLDGSSRREGVVVLAACNNPAALDPALVRSGRLDRRFEIGLPDEDALLRIFGHHLPGADLEDLAPAATVLAGSTSGADVARIAREARRVARRAGREVTAQDLLAIAMPPDPLSPRDRRLVAVHEAGHAVACLAQGRIPDSLSVVAGQVNHGGVLVAHGLGMGRLAEVEAEVVVRLAGRAAEEVILGEPSAGAENDLKFATALVVQAFGNSGLGGRLLHGERVDGHLVEARLRELYGRALRLIGERRQAVEALADLAMERRVLGKKALEAFAAEHGSGGR